MSPIRDPDFEARQASDAAYSWWYSRALVAAIFLPILPLYPLWGWMQETLGPEGAALIGVALQLVSVTQIPHRVAWHMAKRRRTK